MDQAAAHAARLAPYVEPHLKRRDHRQAHPIHDFLFAYYTYRPAQLMRWQPAGPIDPAKRRIAEKVLALLRATSEREANFGCFGMHEWAMVYRDSATRHPYRLRLGSDETDRAVESHRLGCSHWDAVRFFTAPALPLNTVQPGRDRRAEFEQPGCLHANMDLYMHSYKLADVVGSDLVADAFELAWDARIMDMRAAPYDLTGVTIDPYGIEWTSIKVETAEGKREYAELQRHFARRAAPIRQRLADACQRALVE